MSSRNFTELRKAYLSFTIGKESFALPVSQVIEVLRGVDITMVPKSEEYIEGVINFRGEILSVVNMRQKLNIRTEKGTERGVVIVCDLTFEDKKVMVGAMADKVKNVLQIADSEIKSVPDFGSYYNPEFLTGAIKLNDGFAMVLDIEKIFNSNEVELLIENQK